MRPNTHPEIACLCGCREPADDQPIPRKCWGCGKNEMGRYDRQLSTGKDYELVFQDDRKG